MNNARRCEPWPLPIGVPAEPELLPQGRVTTRRCGSTGVYAPMPRPISSPHRARSTVWSLLRSMPTRGGFGTGLMFEAPVGCDAQAIKKAHVVGATVG